MTSALLRPWALPCLLLLLFALPRAACAGGMGVSAPPCGVTADTNGVNQSDPPHTYDLPFHYYKVPFSRAPHANRDMELMWSDTYLSRYGKRLDTLGTDGLTDLDRLGISACDTEHNPLGMPWTDIRLMYNFLADQRNLRDSTGALVPRASEYNPEPDEVGFQGCQTNDPEAERSHFDLYLYVPAFQPGHGYASYLGDGSDGVNAIPNYGLWKSTYHWPTEDSTTVLDEAVYSGNSIQITGPRPWEVGATDDVRWTRSNGLANSQIMHEGLHALNNGGPLHMRASAAEMITGWCDDAPQDDVDYHYSLSPASGNISNAYPHWQSFSAWLAFNWRGDPAPGLWQDDLLTRWSKAPASQQYLFNLGQRLRDSECAQCVDYPGFAGLDGTARVQKLLHDWRVACYVGNPNLTGGYYGFPSEPAFSPANDLGAWQNVDHTTSDDGFAVPPVVRFGADDLNRPRWFTERPAGPGFDARPLRMSMFGAEYFVVRADAGLSAGKHLIVQARPDPLRYAKNPYANCQPVLVDGETGRLFASVVSYSQSADSLFRHPEWATSVTTQSVLLDSVGRGIEFDIPDFGGATKAALVVLTLGDGPTGGFTAGNWTQVQDSLAVTLGLTVMDGESPRPAHGAATTPATETEPTWSPDGTQLAYRAPDENGVARIYRRASDGSGPLSALRSASLGQSEPDWSPRGDRVAYVEGKLTFAQGDSVLRQVWLVDPTTGSAQRLTTLAGVAHAPACSPNGSEVAYLRELVQGLDYLWEVRRVNVATGADELVISYSGLGELRGLRWSPDGRELSYSRFDITTGKYHLHRHRLGDVAPTSLDSHAPGAKAWALSPGRGPLLVEDLRGWPLHQACDASDCQGCQPSTYWLSAHRIALLDTLTGVWTAIEYRTGADYSLPRFSPDGTKVAYVTTQNGNPDVYVASTTFDRAPAFTSQTAYYLVAACQPFNLPLSATDPDGDPITREVFDLPAGAVLQGDGTIHWEYPVVGHHWIIARALDPQGAVASRVIHLDVVDEGSCGGGGGEGGDPDPIIPGGNAARHVDSNRLIGGGGSGPMRAANTLLDGAASGAWVAQTVRLQAARADSAGQVTARLVGLRPGTLRVDRARLLVADHAPGTIAVATGDGVVAGAKRRPASIVSGTGEELSHSLAGRADDARRFAAGSSLTLTWSPADSIAGLVVDCARASAAEPGSDWGVRVEVEDGGDWQLAGHLRPRGGYDALAAPLTSGARVRLVFASDTYVREVAGYALASGEPAAVTAVELSGTDSGQGVEWLAAADTAAVALAQGERLTLLFDGPLPAADRQRTLFLDLVASFTPEGLAGAASHSATEVPPLSFALHANRPNPFGGGTTIRFDVPRTSAVRLEVFDAQGRRVRTLAESAYEPGRHLIVWDGTDSSGRRARPGVYLYRMTTDAFRDQRRMVLLGR